MAATVAVVAPALAMALGAAPAPAAAPADRPAGDRPTVTYIVNNFSVADSSGIFGGSTETEANTFQTVGQTIHVPATATRLHGFTFKLYMERAAGARAYVYAWKAAEKHAVGHALFRSHVIDINVHDWTRVRFDTHRLQLHANRDYVLFISVSGNPEHRISGGSYFLSPQGSYTQGQFVGQHGYGTHRWVDHKWRAVSYFGDMAFRMRLTS